MSWFWTTGILIILGLFAVVLFINPNLSWMVKRVRTPVRSIFSNKFKKSKTQKTEDYGFKLNDTDSSGTHIIDNPEENNRPDEKKHL